MTMVKFEVHICRDRRSYVAAFSTEDQAIDFYNRKSATHAMWPVAEELPASWTRLYAIMNPTCEHGLSANLCYGPMHYMSAAEEFAQLNY